MFKIQNMSCSEKMNNGLNDTDWFDKQYKIVRDDGKVVDCCLTWDQAECELQHYQMIADEIELERSCED